MDTSLVMVDLNWSDVSLFSVVFGPLPFPFLIENAFFQSCEGPHIPQSFEHSEQGPLCSPVDEEAPLSPPLLFSLF